MPTSTAIRSIFIPGPAGRLEALLNEGASNTTHAALVCHPHPLYGGTMHNKVVFHGMKALNGFGIPVLRFNFRGAGRSAGKHDLGRGESDDVRAALDWLKREFTLPIIFAGFSFGASTGLRAACPDPRVVALISLGTPIAVEGRSYQYRHLQQCAKPKLFVSGGADEFGPREQLERVVAAVPEPKRLVLIDAADHFFHGHLAEMRHTVEAWVGELLASKL